MTPPELIPGGVPLTSVSSLTAGQIHTLNGIWIDTAQELVGIYGTNEPTRSRLAAALGIRRAALDPIVNAAQRLIPLTRDLSSVAVELEAAETEYGLGALLDDPVVVQQRHRSLPAYAGALRAPLPESHSLLEQLPSLRNQGRRGTCVAHAALSVREQLEITAGAPRNLDLSEQFVYWWCKEHDGLPARPGTFLSLGMRCLAETGAPVEALWPYVNTSHTNPSQGQGPPPESAAGGDPAFRTAQTQELNRLDLAGMKTCLVEGRSIAVALPVYESWYKSSAMARWGKITLPLTGEPAREGHAVTLVGYQNDRRAPGGGYFLVRNSWQPWAWDGVWASGYGYLPYAYIIHHANTIFSARRLTGASLHLRDRADAPGQPQAGAQSWNSPDIWLRQRADAGVEPQMPAPGRENALYVRVFNRGPACAYRVAVNATYAPLKSVGSVDGQREAPIGRLEAPMLWPGPTVLGPLMWTPPGTGPYTFLARILADTQP